MRSEARRAGHSAAYSLLELLAVVTIVGIVAALAIARLSGNSLVGKKNACYVTKGSIELQVQLWHRHKGGWPATNLSDIGADQAYFPEGLPACPVDGSSYAIDGATHRVTGHAH